MVVALTVAVLRRRSCIAWWILFRCSGENGDEKRAYDRRVHSVVEFMSTHPIAIQAMESDSFSSESAIWSGWSPIAAIEMFAGPASLISFVMSVTVAMRAVMYRYVTLYIV